MASATSRGKIVQQQQKTWGLKANQVFLIIVKVIEFTCATVSLSTAISRSFMLLVLIPSSLMSGKNRSLYSSISGGTVLSTHSLDVSIESQSTKWRHRHLHATICHHTQHSGYFLKWLLHLETSFSTTKVFNVSNMDVSAQSLFQCLFLFLRNCERNYSYCFEIRLVGLAKHTSYSLFDELL